MEREKRRQDSHFWGVWRVEVDGLIDLMSIIASIELTVV